MSSNPRTKAQSTLALIGLLLLAGSACRTPGAAATAQIPKVLLIGIDGCRPDALLAAETPALDELIADGAFTEAQTCARTSSGPSWSSLLTGTWPAKHGVVDNSFEGAEFERYPHAFVRAKQARPELVTASFAHWAPIEEHVVAAADSSAACADMGEVVEQAVTCLTESDPDFLFLHLDDVDHAGHAHGYAPDVAEYIAAITSADRAIGQVMDAVQTRASYDTEDWLVLVTTDHGGSGTGHGQDIPEHRTIFLVVSGRPDGMALGEEPAIVDAIPTALAHLGIKPRADWELDGRVLLERPRGKRQAQSFGSSDGSGGTPVRRSRSSR